MCNTPIYVKASILKNAMIVVSKSKTAVAFVNAKQAAPERVYLLKMGYAQLATLFKIDSATAHSILTKQLISKRSKFINVRFYWLQD